jgi:plasmid stabilization system protein ParE
MIGMSRDSRERAEPFTYRLIAETDKLQSFPEVGRVVPEYDIATLRELIVRSYRIVYRLDHEAMLVEIARMARSKGSSRPIGAGR